MSLHGLAPGPHDDGYDEDGYDESQRAEILEATRDGPSDGTILTDLSPDLGEDDLDDEPIELNEEIAAAADPDDSDDDDLDDDELDDDDLDDDDLDDDDLEDEDELDEDDEDFDEDELDEDDLDEEDSI